MNERKTTIRLPEDLHRRVKAKAALQGTTIYAVGGWSRDYVSLNMVFRPLPFQILIPSTER